MFKIRSGDSLLRINEVVIIIFSMAHIPRLPAVLLPVGGFLQTRGGLLCFSVEFRKTGESTQLKIIFSLLILHKMIHPFHLAVPSLIPPEEIFLHADRPLRHPLQLPVQLS